VEIAVAVSQNGSTSGADNQKTSAPSTRCRLVAEPGAANLASLGSHQESLHNRRPGANLSYGQITRREGTRCKHLSDGCPLGDLLADERSEWKVIGRPYATAAGKTVHVRVESVRNPGVTAMRSWGAHERISVKRASAEEGKR
jgi:hypothetical protein